MQDKVTYYTTGMQRATEFTIDKKLMGNSLSGYPHTYKLADAFEGYEATNKNMLMQISSEDFKTRLNAFIAYIENKEGISKGRIKASDAYRVNLTACPIINE